MEIKCIKKQANAGEFAPQSSREIQQLDAQVPLSKKDPNKNSLHKDVTHNVWPLLPHTAIAAKI